MSHAHPPDRSNSPTAEDTGGFRAFVVTRSGNEIETAVRDLDPRELPGGEVTIRVEWSSVNYKDAMTTQPGNRVARISPLVPGVDLVGTVSASEDPGLSPGTEVVVHGYDLGVAHHGGFAELARVPASWVVPLPPGLTPRDAAIVGTAGFTAALSLDRLEALGTRPGDGPVLVTGASGGVGSMAVLLCAARGYEVVASTGKAAEHEYLLGLGASEVIGRDALAGEGGRTLGTERWAAAVDCVGGAPLAAVLAGIRYGGAVAASGLTAGSSLETTVFPFIVRNVSLLGVDSVQTPLAVRRGVWNEIAARFPRPKLEAVVEREVGLVELGPVLAAILEASVRGRVLVSPSN
jgi:acrylyl-CoA reductase (NADPH)